jgi:hypothetical protein
MLDDPVIFVKPPRATLRVKIKSPESFKGIFRDNSKVLGIRKFGYEMEFYTIEHLSDRDESYWGQVADVFGFKSLLRYEHRILVELFWLFYATKEKIQVPRRIVETLSSLEYEELWRVARFQGFKEHFTLNFENNHVRLLFSLITGTEVEWITLPHESLYRNISCRALFHTVFYIPRVNLFGPGVF